MIFGSPLALARTAMPLLLVFCGVALVVGGILVFRLHAFLALLLGALTIALLTPAPWIERSAVRAVALKPVASEPGLSGLAFAMPEKQIYTGLQLDVLRLNSDGEWKQVGRLEVRMWKQPSKVKPIPATIYCEHIAGEEYRAGDLAVPHHDWLAVESQAKRNGAERVAAEFGKVCGNIGILIALAALVGRAMLDSGAADRIVRTTLGIVGVDRAPLALAGSGFLLGIPVFFDTVFLMLLPLAKATRRQAGGNYVLLILAIVCGATMTHSLVPPTPGPLFAAQGLKVDMGTMILGGLLVGAVTSTVGFLFACWATRNWDITPPDDAVAAEPAANESQAATEAVNPARADDADLPPIILAIAPILLPVLLISGDTALTTLTSGMPADSLQQWKPLLYWASLLGQKDLAMALAALCALAMLVAWKQPSWGDLSKLVEQELSAAGSIILITAAGGAFGGAITQTGVADLLRGGIEQINPLWILPIAFAVTSAVRTAQGSATVAMITAVGMFAPFAEPGLLPFHPVYLALAIGCGSKPFTWMADSGFWVISRMSGLSEWEALQTVTPQMALMGFAGLFVVWIGAWIWPLV